MTYECEYCGSRYSAEPTVCTRCGATRLRRIAAPPPPPAPQPAAAPDWRGLRRWMDEGFVQPSPPCRTRCGGTPSSVRNSRSNGEVEENADSVRLVLVAGERVRDAFWSRVSFVPPPAVPDSAWPSYRYPLLETGARRTNEEPYRHIRFLAVPADSAVRATAWRVASMDSVQVRFTGGTCVLPYLIPEQEKEQLRRVLRLYELKKRSHPEARR